MYCSEGARNLKKWLSISIPSQSSSLCRKRICGTITTFIQHSTRCGRPQQTSQQLAPAFSHKCFTLFTSLPLSFHSCFTLCTGTTIPFLLHFVYHHSILASLCVPPTLLARDEGEGASHKHVLYPDAFALEGHPGIGRRVWAAD